MRVLLVSHHAPPHIGGVEQVVWAEAQTMLTAGHSVTWITSDGSGAGQRLPQHPDLRLIQLPAWHGLEKRFGIAYPFHAPSLVPVLWREVGDADLVHVHGLVFQVSIVAAIFARLRGRRCLLTDHGGILRYRSRLGTLALRFLIETAGRITARSAHRLVAINTEIAGLLGRLRGRPGALLCLANPLADAGFAPPSPAQRRRARAALGWDARPRVLFVGRLAKHKGIDVLLASAAPDTKLVFCGPGDLRTVQQIVAGGGQYLAPRPQPDLLALYHAADVLALPSRNEGFPLVAQEALACGLPVVTTDTRAYDPYRDLPGLHLCEATPVAVRETIQQVLQLPQRVAVRKRTAHRFDGQTWLAKLLEGIA